MSFNWLFRRSRRDEELDEEIQAHLAMAIRDRINRGEEPEAAEFAARREFGNRTLVKETTRSMWGGNLAAVLWQDVRYALRGMRRSPGFTAVAAASLALGIGANTTIFTLMNTVMLRLLPVQHPDELVELLQKYPGEPRGNGFWTWKSYEHFREQNSVFSALIGTSIDNLVRVGAEHRTPDLTIGEYVTSNYFSVLGVTPAIGRLIGPEDDPNGSAGSTAVLSWSYWTNKLQQDPEVLGKRIFVQDQPVTVIGIAPRTFVGLRIEAATDVWLPRKPSSPMGLALLGRLKHGATLAMARAEMAVLYRFTIEERAARSKDPLVHQLKVEVEPAGNGLSTVRDRFGKPLVVLMCIVGLLLLIACVNIAGLLLARGAGREREMAVRVGLGASRSRLAAQVLTESVMLSSLGALAGIVLSYFGTAALARTIGSGRVHEQIHLRIQPDLRVLLFAAGIAMLTGLFFGLAPAWNAIRSTPAPALRQAGGSGETRSKRLFGKGLVAAQIALSVLLLSAAGLFIAHLWKLEHTDLGFRRDHVLLIALDPLSSNSHDPRLPGDYQELLERLQRIPGVRSVSLCSPTPLSGAGASGFATAEGFQERPSDRRWVSISSIAPHYFETLGSPLLAGRDFSLQDQSHSRIAIINQTMARHYFAGRNPIGQHVTLDHVTGDREPKTYEIVGVAGNANYLDIREPPMSSIYLPAFHDGTVSAQNFAVRTNIDPEKIAGDARTLIQRVLKTIPVARMVTLTQQIDSSIVPERLIATLSGFFAGLGALLAGIGLYGLLAYTVVRRTNEIGIRLALGATTRNVALMVTSEALTIVAGGLILGVPLAMGGRALAARLIGDVTTQAAGPAAAGAAILLAVALLALYLPARRAACMHPLDALRHD